MKKSLKIIGSVMRFPAKFISTAVAVVFLILAIYFFVNAKKIGETAATTAGTFVGSATGSFEGITTGLSEGKEAGEEAGLSGEDTTADVANTLKEIGKLEVLIAGVTLTNLHELGEAYSSLSIISGEAVFTVDLKQIEISASTTSNIKYVTIPEPVVTLYLDTASTKLLAEAQKFSWNVDAEDSVTAYLNTMKHTVKNTEESISNYDSLFQNAKESAKKQVEQLVGNVSLSDKTIAVKFK